MVASILNTIKQALGVSSSDTGFDAALLLDINTAIGTLNQIGVGPTAGFVVNDETQVWGDLLGSVINLEEIKSYILHKVRLSFDPPTNSFLVTALENQIKELEYRIMVKADPPYVPPPEE